MSTLEIQNESTVFRVDRYQSDKCLKTKTTHYAISVALRGSGNQIWCRRDFKFQLILM